MKIPITEDIAFLYLLLLQEAEFGDYDSMDDVIQQIGDTCTEEEIMDLYLLLEPDQAIH